MRILRIFSHGLFALVLALGASGGGLAAEASRVSIGLQGRISPKCSLSDMAGQLDFGSLSSMGSEQERAVTFTVTCNTPFTYAISSANGEMRNPDAIGSAAYSGRFTYNLLLTIPTDDGKTLRTFCGSSQLLGNSNLLSCGADSGDMTSVGKPAALKVSWGPVVGPLLAGGYRDNLAINLMPKQ